MINTEEFRKFAVKGQNISGTAVDDYVQHVENMTRAVIEESVLQIFVKLMFFHV